VWKRRKRGGEIYYYGEEKKRGQRGCGAYLFFDNKGLILLYGTGTGGLFNFHMRCFVLVVVVVVCCCRCNIYSCPPYRRNPELFDDRGPVRKLPQRLPARIIFVIIFSVLG
jgi:hypothetical protein